MSQFLRFTTVDGQVLIMNVNAILTMERAELRFGGLTEQYTKITYVSGKDERSTFVNGTLDHWHNILQSNCLIGGEHQILVRVDK